MTDEYTPTTEQVRNDFATRMAPVMDGARRAAFDRWLAAHDRETAARAWDEGQESVESHWAYGNDEPSNPYREEVDHG